MSRQGGGRSNGGGVARGAGFAAAKGGILIALAVVIGIVLLNVVDDGGVEEPASEPADATTTTTGETGTTDETTGTTSAEPPRPAAELAVLVLNGGAPAGTAAEMSESLGLVGYTDRLPAADWTGREQEGNVVMCKEGLDREASTLATAVGDGTTVEPFADPAPPGSEAADCVVVVGATG